MTPERELQQAEARRGLAALASLEAQRITRARLAAIQGWDSDPDDDSPEGAQLRQDDRTGERARREWEAFYRRHEV